MSDVDITKFRTVTKTNDLQARSYLRNAKGVLMIAINMYFNKMSHEDDTSRALEAIDDSFANESDQEKNDNGEGGDSLSMVADTRLFDENNQDKDVASGGGNSDGSRINLDDYGTLKDKEVIIVDDELPSLYGSDYSSLQCIKEPYTLTEFKNMWKSEFQYAGYDDRIFLFPLTIFWD